MSNHARPVDCCTPAEDMQDTPVTGIQTAATIFIAMMEKGADAFS